MSAAVLKRNHRIRQPLFGVEEMRGLRKHQVKWVPSANVTGTPGAYTIKMAVPGLERECFQIHVKGKELVVSGNKEENNDVDIRTSCEYDFSAWQRSFLLPEDADTIMAQASYKNGELIIIIPRSSIKTEEGESDVFIY